MLTYRNIYMLSHTPVSIYIYIYIYIWAKYLVRFLSPSPSPSKTNKSLKKFPLHTSPLREHTRAYVEHTWAYCQHTSAYVKAYVTFAHVSSAASHQHTCPNWDPCWQHTSACVSIHQHTSAYVSIRQHTSAYVSIRCLSLYRCLLLTHAPVSIRQHTSAYVSIRQHTLSFSLPLSAPDACSSPLETTDGTTQTTCSVYISILI